MKFTLSWLKKHLHTSAAITEICNKLTDIGLEVEEYEKDENNQDKFLRIATIKSTKPHPNADKLQICQVEVDQAGSLLQIICGASNARANLKTIYAPIGATIPENKLKIKKSQIRGVESFGMLCSESELGLSENSEGIIEISKDFTNGTNIDKIFQKQHLIDVNITPNRGDCLGVFGIARDLAATNIGSLINLPKINFKQEGKSLNIELNSNKCQYITLRNISNLQNNQSPIWLKNILEKIGISSYNAIVDITNYVMFTTGHPVHIYDSDNISGNKITISEAKDGDAIISLKDQKLEFKKGDIIALDNKNIIALSGIIGEKNSSISNQTKNIIIEAAIFDKNQIAQTSRRLKIETDSKYRFERGVDLEMIDYAVDLTASMIQEICQGVISERSFSGNKSKNIKSINFELTEIKKLLAIDISKSEIIAILEKLSFMVGDKDKEILQITPPSFRNDIKIKNDIIEEIARIYGFNKIEPKKPENLQINRNHPNWQELLSKKLVNNGFNETINWSFIKKDDLKIFSAIDEDLKISNPINIDMEYMRNSLLPSLIKNIKFNISKGHEKLSLFEIGNIFDSTNFSKRKDIICAARSGFNKDKNIHNKRRQFDILDLKKDLLDCLEIFNIKEESLYFIKKELPHYFNPYKAAIVKLGNKIIAHIGEIHPLIAKKFNITQAINVFELFIDKLPQIKIKNFKEFITNDLPIVKRDLCFIFEDNDVNILEVKKEIKKSHMLISKVNIFDIYSDSKISNKQKSIAFNIEITPKEQTLKLEEIESISKIIIENINSKFHGKIR